MALRSPFIFINDIKTPTFVIEGAEGNDFEEIQEVVDGAPLEFHRVPGANHFTVLAPLSEVVARQILADTGAKPKFRVEASVFERALKRRTAPSSDSKLGQDTRIDSR